MATRYRVKASRTTVVAGVPAHGKPLAGKVSWPGTEFIAGALWVVHSGEGVVRWGEKGED